MGGPDALEHVMEQSGLRHISKPMSAESRQAYVAPCGRVLQASAAMIRNDAAVRRVGPCATTTQRSQV